MAQAQVAHKQSEIAVKPRGPRHSSPGSKESTGLTVELSFEAQKGLSKTFAAQLFHRVAATSSLPMGKLRAELIPDSSWKRAGKTLGYQASQTAARLNHVLSLAERVWGNETDATEWLNSPHAELRGSTPLSMLRTEAGGRAVEALLGALEFGFPV
jgi:putative toxin-antitoxin system antitoxin component (TIGR02293 family)